MVVCTFSFRGWGGGIKKKKKRQRSLLSYNFYSCGRESEVYGKVVHAEVYGEIYEGVGSTGICVV